MIYEEDEVMRDSEITYVCEVFPVVAVRSQYEVGSCKIEPERTAIMAQNDQDDSVRKHVLYLLRGGGAHMSFDDVVNSFPADLCNRQVEGLPYTPWQVLEHMRIAQWDILEFSRDANHVSPEFPRGYWPKPDDLGTPVLWQKTIDEFRKDLQQMEALVEDPSTDLYAKIPHGDGQTILREALLIADHNAYHLGVVAVMGRIVKAVPK
jgi:DinB family protein